MNPAYRHTRLRPGCPGDKVLETYEWARNQCDTGVVSVEEMNKAIAGGACDGGS